MLVTRSRCPAVCIFVFLFSLWANLAGAAYPLTDSASAWRTSGIQTTFDGIEGLLLGSAEGGHLSRPLPAGKDYASIRGDVRDAQGVLDILLIEAGNGRSHLLQRVQRAGSWEASLASVHGELEGSLLVLRTSPGSRFRLADLSLMESRGGAGLAPEAVRRSLDDLPAPLAGFLAWQWEEAGADGRALGEFIKWARGLKGLWRQGQFALYRRGDGVAVFLEQPGSVSLQNIVRLSDGVVMQQRFSGGAASNLWAVEMLSGARILPEPNTKIRFVNTGDSLEIHWDDPAPEVKKVSCEIAGDGESGFLFDGSIQLAADRQAYKLDLPVVAGMALPEPGAELFVPRGHGRVDADPIRNGVSYAFTYPSPFMMQFGSYSDGVSGMYWETRDSEGVLKEYRIGASGAEVQLAISHFLPLEMPEAGYRVPYEVRLAPFAGDWFDAAVVYRGWALDQPWVALGKMPEGEQTRLLEIDGWLWMTDWQKDPERLRGYLEHFPEDRFAVLNHRWRKDEFDVNYPVYEAFDPALLQEYVDMTRDAGGFWMPYFNVRAWQRETPSWHAARAGRYEIIGRDGKPDIDTFMGNPQSVMDPSSEFWQETVLEFVERISHEFGMEGAYLDQLGASFPKMNFDPSAPGYGDPAAWTRGQVRMGNQVLEKMRVWCPDFVTTTETCTELFIPHRDAALLFYIKYAHDFHKWTPAYQAVYHPYDLTFGQPALPRQPQFRFLAARDLLMGNQPFLNIDGYVTDTPGEIAFFEKLLAFHGENLEFLAWGEMLRPPEVEAELVAIDWEWKGKEDVVQNQMPIAAGAWEAPDGRVLLAAVNHTETPARARITFYPGDGAEGLVLAPHDSTFLEHFDRIEGASSDRSITYEGELPAEAVAGLVLHNQKKTTP